MSYRIRLSIEKRKDLKDYLEKDFSNNEEHFFDFGGRSIELHDELPIKKFKAIKKYKDEEYSPYILNKKDFQIILDYYKVMIRDNFSEKEKDLDNFNKLKKYKQRDVISSLNTNTHYISNYFKNLIKTNKNISSSGMFLMDYFYLVKLFENIKRNEFILITHG